MTHFYRQMNDCFLFVSLFSALSSTLNAAASIAADKTKDPKPPKTRKCYPNQTQSESDTVYPTET